MPTPLRLVRDGGARPDGSGHGSPVSLAPGTPTLSDLLRDGPCREPAARAVGTVLAESLAHLHADGFVHGAVEPVHVVFTPAGDLRLIPPHRRDAPRRGSGDRSLDEADDVRALAALVARCVIGTVVDARVDWSADDLRHLGCPAELAADLAVAFRRPMPATRLAAVLHRRGARLPDPPDPAATAAAHTPTVDIASVCLPGLSPLATTDDAPAR
jgi:hypothetical protein